MSSSSPFASLSSAAAAAAAAPAPIQVTVHIHHDLRTDPHFNSYRALRPHVRIGIITLPADEPTMEAIRSFIVTRSLFYPEASQSVLTQGRLLEAEIIERLKPQSTSNDRGSAIANDEERWERLFRRLDEIETEIRSIKSAAAWQTQEDRARSRNEVLSKLGYPLQPVPSHVDGRTRPAGIHLDINNEFDISTLSVDDVSAYLKLYDIASTNNIDGDRKALMIFLTKGGV
ncbi:hypothetical protein IAT40_005732 [Kwoniella sp. CBS 6097]